MKVVVAIEVTANSIMVSANNYTNANLPVGTDLSVKKYGDSSGFDKLYLEEKDQDREIIVGK